MISHDYRQTGSIVAGRIALLGIFLAFRALEIASYFNSPPEYAGQIFGLAALSLMWTTVLLVGIWFRRVWARYLMAMALALLLLAGAAINTHLLFNLDGSRSTVLRAFPGLLWVDAAWLAVLFISLVLIVYMPGIRALTKR